MSFAALGAVTVVSGLETMAVAKMLSAFEPTALAGDMIWKRGVHALYNWRHNTLRSFIETGSGMCMVWGFTLSRESRAGFLNSFWLLTLLATLSSILMLLVSEFIVRQSRLVEAHLKDLPNQYVKNSPNMLKTVQKHDRANRPADRNTPVHLYLIFSMGIAVMRSIFLTTHDVAVALCLTIVASISMVLMGDFFVRMESTRTAGYVLQDRIQNLVENWRSRPFRSLFEISVWLGAIVGSYTRYEHSMIGSIQTGTVVGILACLMSDAVTRNPASKLHPVVTTTNIDRILYSLSGDGDDKEDAKKSTVTKRRKPLKVYTMAEVAEHCTKKSLWIVCHDKVYDVTKYAAFHPGGMRTLERFAGLSATDEVRSMHPDWVLEDRLPRYLIGTVSDPPEVTEVQKDFRQLYAYLVSQDYFVTSLSYYAKIMISLGIAYASVWFMVLMSSNDYVHILAALVLGMFWQQIAFLGHDGGHMAITYNRMSDYNLGLLVGNGLTGISVGWWKSTHNVHHAVPNSLEDDPDIAHLPVFAVSSAMFDSVYNSYHERVMPFDWLARNLFIPYQHYLYYPIMSVARFNLYIQSFIFIFKDPSSMRTVPEAIAMALYWGWYVYLVSFLNTGWMKFAFVFVSHAVTVLLQVQITLSHFSMPINKGREDGYGGDFFTRNVVASLDVDCPGWLDWLHGGLQFQVLHHCFPRLSRRHLRSMQPFVKAICEKHGLPYNILTFWEGNKDVLRTLKIAADKTKTWSPKIWESFNAEG